MRIPDFLNADGPGRKEPEKYRRDVGLAKGEVN